MNRNQTMEKPLAYLTSGDHEKLEKGPEQLRLFVLTGRMKLLGLTAPNESTVGHLAAILMYYQNQGQAPPPAIAYELVTKLKTVWHTPSPPLSPLLPSTPRAHWRSSAVSPAL